MNELREYVKRKFNLSDDDYQKLVENEKERIANPSFEYNGIDLEEAKAMKIKEIKFKAGRDITAIAPVWKQVNVLRGSGKTDPIFTDIDAIRKKSDDLEAKVNDVTTDTVEKVNAIVW